MDAKCSRAVALKAVSALPFLSPASNDHQGFGPEKRLHYRWEYRRFFDRAEVYRLSECTIFRIPNDLKHFRLGITLKARGTSVERNAVKRQVREAFRKFGGALGGFDYNVVIPGTKKMTDPFPKKLALALEKGLKNGLAR